ncbi:MAG TPA: S8 family peptidase, partial [Opitutaceae bacterium]|nr:S8 family peptidase [Opitutaceae bacterium]
MRSGRIAALRPSASAATQLRSRSAGARQAKIEADLAALTATGLYDYVEPDYIQYATALPSDAAFADGTLWGLRNTGQGGGVSGADIDAVAAWDITTGSSAVVVGVIDTGIRYTHQDLAAQVWVNPDEIPGDGIDNDGNGYIDDVHGINAITGSGDPMDDNNHGTHCSGTIGASANDAGPIVGVCWNVRLMGLKFLGAGGSGATSDAIKCIEYALEKGVRILSNSWGGGGYSQALEDAIKTARDQGCLFLAAAGNSGMDADRWDFYPACYDVDNIVSVGALDRSDQLASFTNTGLSRVDLAAPGVDIYSSVASGDSAYASFNGTSMATPHVAGVAALLLARYPALTATELRNRLLCSTREVAALRSYSWSGGAVDAYRALTIAEDGILEVRSSAVQVPLRAGKTESLFLVVTDAAPILGAAVTGALGGGSVVTFHDDGIAPDRAVGDGVYSAVATVPTGVTETTLSATIVKADKATYDGTFSYAVAAAPANDDLATATVVAAGTTTVSGT